MIGRSAALKNSLKISFKDVIQFCVGFAFLVAASKTTIAIGPVPLTMQTFAVGLLGATLGARKGFFTTFAFVAAGFMGLPVFATPLHGVAALFGPTAGYLVSFPLIAYVVGVLAQKGWVGKNLVRSFGAQLLGNLLIVLCGALWLAASVGLSKAWIAGFVPFIIPAVMKATLATAVLFAQALYTKK